MTGRPGSRRSEVGAGKGEVRAEWGRGQVIADPGEKAWEHRWGEEMSGWWRAGYGLWSQN